MDDLPNDLLRHIFTFDWSHEMCLVSSKWTQLGHMKHFRVRYFSKIAEWKDTLSPILVAHPPESIDLRIKWFKKQSLEPMLNQIMLITSLRHLRLEFETYKSFPPYPEVLQWIIHPKASPKPQAPLAESYARLYSIDLQFGDGPMTSAVAEAIGKLGEIPTLRKIRWCIFCVGLTDTHLELFSNVFNKGQLDVMDFHLYENRLTTQGLKRFVRKISETGTKLTNFLFSVPRNDGKTFDLTIILKDFLATHASLTYFYLQSGDYDIFSSEKLAELLLCLASAPSLTKLRLYFHLAGVAEIEQTITGLMKMPKLKDLEWLLHITDVVEEHLEPLGRLKKWTQLRKLHLHVFGASTLESAWDRLVALPPHPEMICCECVD